MRENTKWVIVAEDGNGKTHIFHKWIDEGESWTLEAFQNEVKSHGVTILASFREEDVVSVMSL